jgi:Na+(H+)/acetate symporter ActP
MQFLILLTGVVVFVFYHFEPPRLLWNSREQAQLEQSADAQVLLARHARAADERRAAASTYLKTRDVKDAETYFAADRELQGVRADAVKRVVARTGAAYNDTNYIFPTYILTQLPHGLAGLVIAVIFAAAMSTLSGEFNSLATATMVDFYKRFVRADGGDAHDLLVSRLLTAAWGGFACFVALRAGQLGSAIEVVNRFGSYFYGSILGVFALAVLTPRAGARGAFYGLMLGMASVWIVANTTSVHFLWYNVVGALAVFFSGLAIDRLAPAR